MRTQQLALSIELAEEETNKNKLLSSGILYYGVTKENLNIHKLIFLEMNDIIIGIVVCTITIAFLESVRSVDKRLFGAFTVVGIAFIYVGFAWNDLQA